MYYYTFNDNLVICDKNINYYSNIENFSFKEVDENFARNFPGKILVFYKLNPLKARRSFCISHESLLYLKEENIDIIRNYPCNNPTPNWLISKIKKGEVKGINTEYANWIDLLEKDFPPLINKEPSLKINVVGLGDVGGTLVTGLRLLGENMINKIGIYDKDPSKIKRWEFEGNAIASANPNVMYAPIVPLNEDNLFDCHLFVFCVSVGVPKIGDEKKDVRIRQFKGNDSIIKSYAKLARECNFKGIFAVVSDPVDLLCKSVFQYSNTDDKNHWDFKGLAPEQIRGYGLGVMNGRAIYYSKDIAPEYIKEGRAFGPHGEGLVIANSIENYDDTNSLLLTQKTKNANLEVRAAGFKPYVAPALSSGAISILDTLKGHWNYSATFIGGNFFGCKNRFTEAGVQLETLKIPENLLKKLKETYTLLDETYSSIKTL